MIRILKALAILILMLVLWYAGYIVGNTNIAPQESGLGGVACRDAVKDDIRLPSPLGDLPTIKEIQERIGANPDGILGQETQRLWDLKINDQYAREYFE